jgi:hypothetical protein
MTGFARERLGTALLGASLLASALGLIAAWTGGFRVYVLGVGLSARGPHRAFLVAAALAAAALTIHASARSRLLGWLGRTAWGFHVAAGTTAILVLALGLVHGTKAPVGADGYGYVSQADLWLAGDLRIHQPLVHQVPWPAAAWTFTPLGYRPAPDGTIVPAYAPGIPLLMAVLKRTFGQGAEYWLHPLCGALLILWIYLLGIRLSGHAVGLVAAVWTAASPLVLFLTLGLLGDLPAAVFWTGSLVLSLRPGTSSALGAGLAAALAIVIRPNLVPLAIIPPLLIFARTSGPAALRNAGLFAAGATPGVLFIAWLFADLYGSPFTSGYGDNSYLFSAPHVPVNLRQFLLWTWQSHGPLPFLFAAAAVMTGGGIERRTRIALTAFVILVFACYAAYLPFEEWWYLRFLLPALPIAFLLSTDAMWRLSGRTSDAARFAVRAGFLLGSVGFSLHQTGERRVLESARTAARYEAAGHHVRDHLPGNAVLYAMEHSGSIRYYSGRTTLRYDMLEPGWLDRSVDHLAALGYPAYLAVEVHEAHRFRERFAGQRAVRALDGHIENRADLDMIIVPLRVGPAPRAPAR